MSSSHCPWIVLFGVMSGSPSASPHPLSALFKQTYPLHSRVLRLPPASGLKLATDRDTFQRTAANANKYISCFVSNWRFSCTTEVYKPALQRCSYLTLKPRPEVTHFHFTDSLFCSGTEWPLRTVSGPCPTAAWTKPHLHPCSEQGPYVG